jgi:mRNA interferase MazF
MASYSKNDVVLVRYPFSDLTGTKVRPAVVVNGSHPSRDSFVVPFTSRTTPLLPGEFILADWSAAGLNVVSAVKRGVYTVDEQIIIKRVGQLSQRDAEHLHRSLREWLGFP